MRQTATRDDPYVILGVPRGASDRTIAAAHRALARRYHPDIAGDGATVHMIRINAALDAIRRERRGLPGHGVDPTTGPSLDRKPNDGTGAAGPPPGRPSGSVLDFGRHKGWSIGEVARVDPGYLQWLEERREGRPYLAEIEATLARVGYRPARPTTADQRSGRGGWFRRG